MGCKLDCLYRQGKGLCGPCSVLAWWKERSQDLRKFTYVSLPRWDYLRIITYYLRSPTYVVLRVVCCFSAGKMP